MRPWRKPACATGFALAEVLVALTIFSVGLLGVAGIGALAAEFLKEARILDEAVAEMEEIGDSLRSHGFRGPGERDAGPGARIEWRSAGPTAHGSDSSFTIVEIRAVRTTSGAVSEIADVVLVVERVEGEPGEAR